MRCAPLGPGCWPYCTPTWRSGQISRCAKLRRCIGDFDVLRAGAKHRPVLLGEPRERIQRGQDRWKARKSRRTHRRIGRRRQQRVQASGHRRAHRLHADDVLLHPRELDVGAQHVGLTAIAHLVHLRRDVADVLEQAPGLAGHAERAVHRVDVVEGHRRALAQVERHVADSSRRRVGTRRFDDPGEPEFPVDGNHLHELELRHADRVHRTEVRQFVVHPAELKLRVRQPA